MTTTTPPTVSAATATPKKSKRTALIAGVAGVLVVGGLTTWLVASWPAAQPAPSAEPAKVLAFVASDKWTSLKPEELEKYYDEFDKDPSKFFTAAAALTEEERAKAMENFFRTRMTQTARKYAKLSPEDKKKELDKMIDGEAKRRAAMRGATRPSGGGPGGPGGPGGGRGNWGSPSAMKGRMESMPPGDRAAMSQMMADMMKRRVERGVTGGWGPGGGGGGGGQSPAK